jgi:hypothetical protein
MGKVFLAVMALGLLIYAFTDCVQTDNPAYLRKAIWLLVIVLVPIIGPLLWMTFGKRGGWWDDGDEPQDPIGDPATWRDFERQF